MLLSQNQLVSRPTWNPQYPATTQVPFAIRTKFQFVLPQIPSYNAPLCGIILRDSMIHRKQFFFQCCRGLNTLINPIYKPLNQTQYSLSLSPENVNSAISNFTSDTASLRFFLWCGEQPDYFHAPSSFDRMVPVVDRLTDRLGSVRNIIEELRSIGCPIKGSTFLFLLRIYWRGCSYKFAAEVLDEMTRYHFEPNTFARNIIIDVLFKIGHVDNAMRFIRETQSPNFLTYTIALTNLCKIGDWFAARDMLKNMVDKSFYPTIGSFWHIFYCCRKRGTISELFQLLGFMLVSGMQPTLPIWSILIDGLCHGGEIDMACRYVQKMLQLGISPSVVTYTSLIKGLFKVKRYDLVIELLDFMKYCNCKPDLVFYNVLIDCFAKARRYNDAIGIFFDLLRNNFKPDKCTLSTMMSVLCVSGKTKLFDTLISQCDVRFDLRACNSVMSTLCKAGSPYRAIKFFNHMVENGFKPDNYTYSALFKCLFQLGRIDTVVHLYCKLVTENSNLDSYVHAAILGGLVKRGKYYKATELLRRAILEKHKLDAVCYTIGINGLFRAGMKTEACDLFDRMKCYGVSPNLHTYNVIIHGLCMAKDLDSLQEVLQEMKFRGIEMDSVSFNTLIAYLFKSNRTRSALALLRRMVETGLTPNKVTSVLVSRYLGCEFGKEVGNFGISICDKEDMNRSDASDSDSSDDNLMCSSM
ncbi:Pentatricopeptide repeat (PPR) superfamily protein [Rhynchospora pubera]|uniref:Pentatricopeptide repeat (PPR) superfamily protein n=1 Tax=Rhynchospora pubera TaxID=906938 RepID=A0AAV8BS25_9POAL|nr:Pentatricopeptide repeat (PPR) superfamily protein [Rhynchospora pubera]